MSKKLQVYFFSESNALHVKVPLMKYNVRKLEISQRVSHTVNEFPLFLPFLFFLGLSNTSSAGAGGIYDRGIGGGGATLLSFLALRELGFRKKGTCYEDFHSVLSAEISDEHYDKAVDLIKNNHGFVSKTT